MGIAALAFWKVNVSLKNPLFIPTTDHIGDHIKAKRRKHNFLQEEVAIQIGVSTDTITNWENKRRYPKVMHMPGIIAFLGYDPIEIIGETLGDRIRRYRLENGLSHKSLGNILGVNASTVRAWEKNTSIPRSEMALAISRLLEARK